MPIFICSIEAGTMSKMLVSSGSSAIGVNIHLAINTIGGDFGMEVNTVSLDSTSLFFVFWFFFFFCSRGRCDNAVLGGLQRCSNGDRGE